jgi:hypothetical protein
VHGAIAAPPPGRHRTPPPSCAHREREREQEREREGARKREKTQSRPLLRKECRPPSQEGAAGCCAREGVQGTEPRKELQAAEPGKDPLLPLRGKIRHANTGRYEVEPRAHYVPPPHLTAPLVLTTGEGRTEGRLEGRQEVRRA